MLDSVKILLLICILAGVCSQLTVGSHSHEAEVHDECWRKCYRTMFFAGICMRICTIVSR
ncbi:unnamed protein product [Cylicocyclus nassatus]|uniref:Uncharacterized protein n=1 Tax=Cylicocyclus nassatus TaxID=53992 RepID=A0AA36HE77_CYLNA|nr:unnamed protein product [Cylicocyclus nassatus]